MDGFELTECIRGQDKLRSLPIVMSPDARTCVDRPGYAVGATSFVTKPVNCASLVINCAMSFGRQAGRAAFEGHRRFGGGPRTGCPPQRVASSRHPWTIINVAKRIANGRAPSQEAAQEIIAAAEALLLKSVVTQDQEATL